MPAPSRDGKRHQSIRQDSNLRHPVCGTGALAAELLIGTPGRIRTCTVLIRNQTPYPLGFRGSVPAARFARAASAASKQRSSPELCGCSGPYEI